MDVAIYECDWHSAPFAFRKLVLMFLIWCKKPIQVKAAPFYELNRPLIALVSDHYVLIVNVKEYAYFSDNTENLWNGHFGQAVLELSKKANNL